MKKLLILLLLIPALSFGQSKLKDAKSNLSSRSSSSSGSSISRTSSGGGGYGAGFFGDLFIELFAFVGYDTFFGQLEYRHFTPYPYYYSNVNGEYDYGFIENDKKSQLRLGANYLVGNIVNSIEINARYRPSPLWGFELMHQSFFEEVRNGTEYLDVTSLGANYYRLRERFITGWFGLGATYVGSGVNTFGPMINIGTEIYPFKPISLHGSYQYSHINTSNVTNFRTQLKYHVKQKAFYLGYHDISIGNVKASGMVLGFEYQF